VSTMPAESLRNLGVERMGQHLRETHGSPPECHCDVPASSWLTYAAHSSNRDLRAFSTSLTSDSKLISRSSCN
jgi:hypothetical protein